MLLVSLGLPQRGYLEQRLEIAEGDWADIAGKWSHIMSHVQSMTTTPSTLCCRPQDSVSCWDGAVNAEAFTGSLLA